ncbi:winged helix-turn-helix domain-containing protein [Blastomonas fulva]|jgi:two-component system OmpR family response regulator|uniref:winged helix-turn-helix domain-containing protein n=1 Tax=Blastomonas fulva TaxID=1550728 RepID=UPI003D2786A2
MWRGDDACLARPGGVACGLRASWLLIGADRAAWTPLARMLAQSLARFGVQAELSDGQTRPSPIAPVLCDARHREMVRSLLDDTRPRLAPLLIHGVQAPQARARLILSGADDAVSGRIAPYELAARMIAAQRARDAAQGIIRLAGFSFDTGLRQLCWRGEIVPLMPREFDLLLVLARHAGLPVSREVLLRSVWRTAFDPGTNSPEVHIFKLRQRLASLGGAVRIETVKRQGYRLVCAPHPRG